MVFVGRLLLVAALLGTVGSTLRCYPHQLAYFNELAGGPENGWRHVLGSSFHWGQDLLAVASWLNREGVSAGQVRLLSSDFTYDPATAIGVGRFASPAECRWELVCGAKLVELENPRVHRLLDPSSVRIGAATWAVKGRD